jgi:hypothetical protein
MSAFLVHERLRQARLSTGEPLRALAQRIGVREGLLRTIEDGCFARLPPGIYARAAIRSYASAVGLDPTEILDACAGALPEVEEPISGLVRLRGGRVLPVTQPVTRRASESIAAHQFSWRPFAAAAIDAGVVAVLLAWLIVCARVATGVPLAALGSSAAGAFAMMGVLFGASYFVWIGGLTGATVGERVAGVKPRTVGASHDTLGAIAARAWRSATVDVRCFVGAGAWVRSAPDHSRGRPGAGVDSGERFASPATADDVGGLEETRATVKLQALVGPSPVSDRRGRGIDQKPGDGPFARDVLDSTFSDAAVSQT